MIFKVGQKVKHNDGRKGKVIRSWGRAGYEIEWDDGRVWTYKPESRVVSLQLPKRRTK